MYYKVVRVSHRDGLVSARQDRYRTIYRLNEWVEPPLKGSKLFVFSDARNAREFAFLEEKIYECEIEGEETPTTVARDSLWISDFWSGGVVPFMPAPIGTILASRVKLIREVTNVL